MKQPLHLIIVSYPSRLDATLETIAHTLARGATEARVVERAQEPSDLRYLMRLWHLRDRLVRRVDLIGHGASGRFKLGDEMLFGSDGTGLALAEEWRPFLAPSATLRLLGCGVAGRDARSGAAPAWNGRALLRQLETRLGGQRRVLAPTRALFTIDYAEDGLSRRATKLLTGSTTPGRHHGRSKEAEADRKPRQAKVHHAARRRVL